MIGCTTCIFAWVHPQFQVMGYLQPITGMITIWTSKHGILPEMTLNSFLPLFAFLPRQHTKSDFPLLQKVNGVSRVPTSKSHHLDRTSRAAFAGYSLFSHGDGLRLIVVALALARGTCPISGSRFPKQQRERVPSFPVQDKILQCKGKGGLSHRLRQQGGANITSEHGGSSTTVHSCDAERRYADDERSRVVRGVTWSGSRQQVRLPRRESYSPLKSRATPHFLFF